MKFKALLDGKRIGQKSAVFQFGTIRIPESFDLDRCLSVLMIFETGGQIQACCPSQEWANASTPIVPGQIKSEKNFSVLALELSAKMSIEKGPKRLLSMSKQC